MKWQPIETAPKDADVLLYLDDDHWIEQGWQEDGKWKTYSGYLYNPKYWMPLPEPPTT